MEDARFSNGDEAFLLCRDGTGRYLDPSGKKYKLKWDEKQVVIDNQTVLNIYEDVYGMMQVVRFDNTSEVIRSQTIVVQVEPYTFMFYHKK